MLEYEYTATAVKPIEITKERHKMQKVIVTGAAAGIGRAIVEECQKNGYYTLACDINPEGLKQLVEDLPLINGEACVLDVSDYQAVEAFYRRMELFVENEEYALVNNAGLYAGKNLLAYTEAEIGRIMDVNIKGALYNSKFFAAAIGQAGAKGRIINISSVSGQEGSSDAVYGLSKAALLGLTKSCAMNFAPHILVNAIAPTMVDTAMMEAIPAWRKEEYNSHNLIKEAVTPKDVADTVMFLLSAQARHYTGATFDLNNGGYLR